MSSYFNCLLLNFWIWFSLNRKKIIICFDNIWIGIIPWFWFDITILAQKNHQPNSHVQNFYNGFLNFNHTINQDLVVTSNENHWIINLFNIVEIFHLFNKFENHWFQNFSNNDLMLLSSLKNYNKNNILMKFK